MSDFEEVQDVSSRYATDQEVAEVQDIRRRGGLDRAELPAQSREVVSREEWAQMSQTQAGDLFSAILEDPHSSVLQDGENQQELTLQQQLGVEPKGRQNTLAQQLGVEERELTRLSTSQANHEYDASGSGAMSQGPWGQDALNVSGSSNTFQARHENASRNGAMPQGPRGQGTTNEGGTSKIVQARHENSGRSKAMPQGAPAQDAPKQGDGPRAQLAVTLKPEGRLFGTYGDLVLDPTRSPALYQTYRDASEAGVITEYHLSERSGVGEFRLSYQNLTVDIEVNIEGNWQQELLDGYNELSRRASHATSATHTAQSRNVDLAQASRTELEQEFLELSQEAARERIEAEHLLTLEQQLSTISRSRYRSEGEYQAAVQAEMQRWSREVERTESRHTTDITRDLSRARQDYERAYTAAERKTLKIEREQERIETRIENSAERLIARQENFENDLAEVTGYTRLGGLFKKVLDLDIPKKTRNRVDAYRNADIEGRKQESLELVDGELGKFTRIEKLHFEDPSAMFSQMSDEKLRGMLSEIQRQRDSSVDRSRDVRERLDGYSFGARFDDTLESAMERVQSTAVATQTELATLEAIRAEVDELQALTSDAELAIVQAKSAGDDFSTYEEEMKGKERTAREALKNWEEGQDKSLMGQIFKDTVRIRRR